MASLQMSVDMTMDFYGYNEPVDIPDAPADAKPFTNAFAGLAAGVDSGR